MRNTIQYRNSPVGDAVMHASRQVWLASLGAAIVTRDWAQTEASSMFRKLVKEGTAIESRTIRVVGDRLEGSFAKANTLWKQARSTVRTTVRQAADTAVTLVQNNMPKSLPKVTLPAMLAPRATTKRRTATKQRVAKSKRVAKTRATKAVKRTTRAAKAATRK